jgi:putative phosphotransacetylase
MKVTLGVSRRHVHLTQEVWTTLFGEEPMVKRNDLGQPGQFATTSKVDVSVGDKKIEGLRVIGPVRKYNQIELAQSDADILGINPPRRQSGDLEGSLPITVTGPCGSVDLDKGAILAEMHIHMTEDMARQIAVEDKQMMSVYRDDEHLFDAMIKIAEPAALELHIDTDEANEYNLSTGDILEFEVCGK